jgi:hypothetical protein
VSPQLVMRCSDRKKLYSVSANVAQRSVAISSPIGRSGMQITHALSGNALLAMTPSSFLVEIGANN